MYHITDVRTQLMPYKVTVADVINGVIVVLFYGHSKSKGF